MTNAEGTKRVKEQLAAAPTMSLKERCPLTIQLLDRAVEGDRRAFETLRTMILNMNEWLGFQPGRITLEQSQLSSSAWLFDQYFQIMEAIVAEREGEGTLELIRAGWGRKHSVVARIDGLPLETHSMAMLGHYDPDDQDCVPDH